MRSFFFSLTFSFLVSNLLSQTTFWYESFGNGCNRGGLMGTHTPTNGTWTGNLTGTNGAQANQWFVSGTENSQPDNTCGGKNCLENAGFQNRSLHIGENIPGPNLDNGATYQQNLNSNTNKRAESPVIDCSAKGNIVLSFKYLFVGNAPNDVSNVDWQDGTGVWQTLGELPPSPAGSCTNSALWTTTSYTLSQTADGTANLQIGFRWQNAAVFAPPGAVSVAIDDVALSGIDITGLKELNAHSIRVKLFPNPVTDKLVLEFDSEIAETITISNPLGQIIYGFQHPAQKQEINLSALQQGIYLLTLQSKNSQRTFKIVKE